LNEHTQDTQHVKYRSAMLGNAHGVFGWFAKRFFDHIRLDHDTENRLRETSKRGTLVYVMRTRSTLDYLFFNYLFLRVGLPLARFANGINLTFFHGFGHWIRYRWNRLLGQKETLVPGVDQLEGTILRQESALIFMRVRALTSERHANPGFIRRLVELQREREEPILLMPQLISWPRKPASKRQTLLDIFFGDRLASGKLRKFIHFIRSYNLASARIGEPIDLKDVIGTRGMER